MTRNTMSINELIEMERKRQIEGEGFGPERDDKYTGGELLSAGQCYLHFAEGRPLNNRPDGSPVYWPFAAEWWKPKTKWLSAIKAGALFMAEKDRRHRKNVRIPHKDPDRYLGEAIHALHLLRAEGGEAKPDEKPLSPAEIERMRQDHRDYNKREKNPEMRK